MPAAMLKGLVLCALALVACAPSGAERVGTAVSPTPRQTLNPTPTVTQEPLAALVDGDGVTLAAYQAELARFEAAQQAAGIELASLGDYQTEVLWALIDRKLLAHAASVEGQQLTTAEVEQRLAQITEGLGGEQGLSTWLAGNGYSLDQFKAALAEEMLAERKVQNLVAELRSNVVQVRARHILVATAEEAQALLERLQGGEDFGELASVYSLDLSTRPGGGDLGWFGEEQLTAPELEQAAFAMNPGDPAQVVQSALGYHLLEVLQREPRPLHGEALQRRREEAVRAWLTNARLTAQIQLFVGP
jgi:parvulin-like peptidyl-prolyl isomerase